MARQSHSDEPLQRLEHAAVPGYRKAFLIAIGVAGLYLAIVLISSPGSAKSHYGDGDKKHESGGKH